MKYVSNLKHVPGYGQGIDFYTGIKLLRGRYGRRVFVQSSERALEKTPGEHLATVAKLASMSEKWLTAITPTAQRMRLLRQRRILSALKQLGSRKLHAGEVAAALSFEHGFGQALHEHLNEVNNLNNRHTIVKGSIPSFLVATRRGALRKIHDLLLKEGKPLDSGQIRGRIKTSKDVTINALAILDLMGLVRKLPENSESKKTQYVYIHEEHARNPEKQRLTVPVWNHTFQILMRLHLLGKPAEAKDLHGASDIFGRKIGVLSLKISRQILLRHLSNLEQAGLVELSKKSRGTSRGKTMVIQLTPLGNRLVRETIGQNALPEHLRKLLLFQGKKEGELIPLQQKTYQRIVQWLRIVKELTGKPSAYRAPRLKNVSEKLGLKKSEVRQAAIGRTPFFGKFSLDTIEKIYLPKLRKEHPELVNTFTGFLGARALTYGEKAFVRGKSKAQMNRKEEKPRH